jgi:hypothetical protein
MIIPKLRGRLLTANRLYNIYILLILLGQKKTMELPHLWEEYLGAEALNLDQPCIFFEDDGVYVSGSPWSGKEDCYKNKRVPLKAIFFVEQAPENSAQKLSVAESFSHLYLNNYLVPFDGEMEKKHQNAVIKLASNVPVYRLKCTISKEAVEAAHKVVFNNKQ